MNLGSRESAAEQVPHRRFLASSVREDSGWTYRGVGVCKDVWFFHENELCQTVQSGLAGARLTPLAVDGFSLKMKPLAFNSIDNIRYRFIFVSMVMANQGGENLSGKTIAQAQLFDETLAGVVESGNIRDWRPKRGQKKGSTGR